MPPFRSPYYQPKQDTGWGLIFRLNDLLGRIERDVEAGDLDKWNLHLDRVFANILHKDPEEVVRDDKTGKIIDIKFSKDDIEIFVRLNEKIEKMKSEIYIIIHNEHNEDKFKREELMKFRKNYYNLLFKKDIWVRKKMSQKKLYLTQIEHNPMRAIYGGG